jgi:adenylate cyclase
MSQQNRQLAAILFTDIVGYTAMMQQNEPDAVMVVKRYISVLQRTVLDHSGKILNDYGDGSLCSFSSATQAVECAIALQQQLQSNPVVPLRIGVHIGEIFFEGEKVLGDGVNVASRIQSLGQSNTILFSKEIFDKIKNQPNFKAVSLGSFEFKNVDDPVEVFALTNNGLVVPKKEQLGGKLKEQLRKPGERVWKLTIATAMLLAVAFFVYREVYHRPEFTGTEKSIAVLPFENIGIDAGVENVSDISDGITQDIINNLSKISSLQKVIGWFSVRRFKKTAESPQQIADELGVAAILSGTIQKESDNLHIIAQLIDVNTNRILWGEDYNYPTKDILIIQTKVAQIIVNALKASLTPEEKKGLSTLYTQNVEAYKNYIRGRTFWNARNKENFDSAETYFTKAIKLDSNYALAYAGIADCYTYNYKGMPQLEAIPIARKYAQLALSIDSNLSEGLTTLGFIQFNFEFNWNDAKMTLRKAIERDPNNSIAHMYFGIALQYSGDTENGLKEGEKAVSLDPLGFAENWVLGRNYYFARRYEDALRQFEKAKRLAPKNNDLCFWSESLIYIAKKMNQNALMEIDKMPKAAVNNIDNLDVMRSYIYAATGDKVKGKQLLEAAIRKDLNASPYRIAEAYIALGDYGTALNWLEEGCRIRCLHMFCARVDPGLDPIRDEPRFKALLKNIGLP